VTQGDACVAYKLLCQTLRASTAVPCRVEGCMRTAALVVPLAVPALIFFGIAAAGLYILIQTVVDAAAPDGRWSSGTAFIREGPENRIVQAVSPEDVSADLVTTTASP